LRSYRVIKAISEKGIYILAELNNAELDNIITNNKLKKFHIHKINLIEDFVYLIFKVFNIINAEKS
jgi:hypothetical protein